MFEYITLLKQINIRKNSIKVIKNWPKLTLINNI